MKLIKKISDLYVLLYSQLMYGLTMHSFGPKSRIYRPMLIANHKHISVGKNVLIRQGVRLEVVEPQQNVVIRIGNNVNIEQNVHIVGRCSITIGDNVSITGGCSIVDVVHPYDDINDNTKIGNRISSDCFPVSIGEQTFIGYGVHINPGVAVGRHCIIGAHSVITRDVPDYCVVAGAPAKVIKKYCHHSKAWMKV